MAVQNYEVQVYMFGEWPRGTVLPEFAVLWAGGTIADLIDRGVVSPSRAPVPKAVTDRLAELARAKAAQAAAPPPVPDTVTAELEQLRTAAAAADEAVQAQTARADAAEKRCETLLAEIANYVETNAHLTRACDEHQAAGDKLTAERDTLRAQVAQLTADLDAATAPKV